MSSGTHNDEALTAYALGLLNETEGVGLEQHLTECELRRMDYADLRETVPSLPSYRRRSSWTVLRKTATSFFSVRCDRSGTRPPRLGATHESSRPRSPFLLLRPSGRTCCPTSGRRQPFLVRSRATPPA